MKNTVTSLKWDNGTLWILDQRKLPAEISWIKANTVESVAVAIENLSVRGAPAIGIAAGYGVAIGARKIGDDKKRLNFVLDRLRKTRPTGYNLFYVLSQMKHLIEAKSNNFAFHIEKLAICLHKEDKKACLKMAKFGFTILRLRTRRARGLVFQGPRTERFYFFVQ